MSNRKKAEDYIKEWVERISPGGANVAIYNTLFASMNDKEFGIFMTDISTGRKCLPLVIPNFGKNNITVERNLEIGKALGHNFFQRLWMGARDGLPAYLTPVPYLVLLLPLRRASQILTKKMAVSDSNTSVDVLTGQAASSVKGARISLPEIQVLSAMDLDYSVKELIKYRGGDVRGLNTLNAMISRYGTANQKTLSQYASGVEATKTLHIYLTCMHIKNNL